MEMSNISNNDDAILARQGAISKLEELENGAVLLHLASHSSPIGSESRPWGAFKSIHSGKRHQVKVITVRPGERLSLQKHFHRSEHWIVISGIAEVTCGDKTFPLYELESTFIPVGEVHRLANPGKIPLEIIEVQLGGYLGEDDIIRFEDAYGRVESSSVQSDESADRNHFG